MKVIPLTVLFFLRASSFVLGIFKFQSTIKAKSKKSLIKRPLLEMYFLLTFTK